jgi:hypothetical protein
MSMVTGEAQKNKFRKVSERSAGDFRTPALRDGSTSAPNGVGALGKPRTARCLARAAWLVGPSQRITANHCDWQIEGWIVKLLTLSVLLAGSIAASGALAQSMNQDDLKWINQCIQDNRDEGASANVVRAYCVCMNEKMDSSEARSITQWEKSNPSARRACERQAGWR